MQTSAQCNDQLIDLCMEQQASFTYLKDFKVRLKKSKKNSAQVAKYSVMLTKGTKYRFTTANASEYESNVVFTLYDENGMLLTNHQPGSDKVYEVVDITCKKSGRYYVTFHFKDGKEGCAAAILGFENKANKIEDLLNY